MVFDKFLKILSDQLDAKSKTPGAQTPPPAPTTPPATTPKALGLPHPEEPMNPSANLSNTDLNAVMTQWLANWGVPAAYWDHWRKAIDIQVYDVYPDNLRAMGIKQETPAAAWESGGKRYLAIKTPWLNPGVIAHEQAHNSYAYLNAAQKAEFAAHHTALKNDNPLVKLLYSKNTYGLSNDVEGHAEIYRYIGQHMPEHLKPYYPALF
jgi:hypothetical protein